MPPKSASRHAPKLDVPLRERNHPEAYFTEEREGWHGYIEWERYPEKKAAAAEILSQYAFDDVGLDISVVGSRINIDFRPAPRIPIEAFARHEPRPRRCPMEAVPCGNGNHPGESAGGKLGDCQEREGRGHAAYPRIPIQRGTTQGLSLACHVYSRIIALQA